MITLLSMPVAFSPFFIGFISRHPQSSSIWPKLSLCFLVPYFDDALYTLLWFTCKAVPHFRILSVLSILESLEPGFDLICTRKHCRKQPSTPVRGAHRRFWQDLIKHGKISCKYGEIKDSNRF